MGTSKLSRSPGEILVAGGGGEREMSLKAHKLALPRVYLRFSTVSSAVVLTIHSMTGEG